ncbi:hypothetical protein BJY01DRAFT_246744 [Aspergillus pseudoustus]|uniref:DUF1214 domain-containing protein n=1 Tax=Aspergillus pseudoustus TaxID=1810923 RepID=A0ABR4K681_9EURO
MKVSNSQRWVIPLAISAFHISSTLAASSVGTNPLATEDQRDLDALAIDIYNSNDFPIVKAAARSAYQTAHGFPISSEALAGLDAAIEELTFSAVQKAVNSDPYYPKVYWVDAGPRTWFDLDVPGGRYSYDNPDCIYRTIPISSDVDYVVTGHRYGDGPTDTSFSLISNVNSQNTIAYLGNADLVVTSDGSYTITINSTSTSAPNHIQSKSSAKQLLIRNNIGDWNVEKPDRISVAAVSDVAGRKPITTDTIVASARANLAESTVTYGIGALGLKTYINNVNTLSEPSQSSTLGTLTSQASSFGHFKLSEEEALVATITPGAATYWVFPVTDPWSVTVDPGSSQISLNSKQAVANTNGTYTFVVSITDPGVYNWINTTGRHEGTTMVRWQGLLTASSDNSGVGIYVQVVPISVLNAVLPSETRYVTAKERAAQLAERSQGYSRRLNY